MHDWHEQAGCLWEDVGQWRRPWYYPHDGESLADADGEKHEAVVLGSHQVNDPLAGLTGGARIGLKLCMRSLKPRTVMRHLLLNSRSTNFKVITHRASIMLEHSERRRRWQQPIS